MKPIIKNIILVLVLALVAGGVYFLESKKPETAKAPGETDIFVKVANQSGEERIAEKEKDYERAKEISSPDGFINISDIKIGDLVGKKVVLLDFWTYSCINCQRTLPYLNSWHEKYADEGLVIIGIHTPEFDFEKEYENVKRAVEKFGIDYPVVLDNDYSTWRDYRNNYWPRKYLIDIDGFIVYDHIGEGGYEETEQRIVEALNEKNAVLGGSKITLDSSTPQDAQDTDFSKVRTPETYIGHSRLEYLANIPSPICVGSVCSYTLPEEISINTFLLAGDWYLGAESAELKSKDGIIAIGFSAGKVNLVAGAMEGTVTAEVLLDGKPVGESLAGSDVKDSRVIFGSHDLYNLIDLRGDYGEHILEIRILEPGLEAFAFTFG